MPRSLRLYLLLGALALGVYAWAGLTGTRLLGDDVASSEGPPTGGRTTGGHGGHRSYSRTYFHK